MGGKGRREGVGRKGKGKGRMGRGKWQGKGKKVGKWEGGLDFDICPP